MEGPICCNCPEKVRSSCPANSLKTTPVKEVIREEVSEDVVEKPFFFKVPHDFTDRATNDYNAENDIEKIKDRLAKCHGFGGLIRVNFLEVWGKFFESVIRVFDVWVRPA